MHNMHYWMRQEKIQNRWPLNVWGGIINNTTVFFLLEFDRGNIRKFSGK
jgi:hypothetical protein